MCYCFDKPTDLHLVNQQRFGQLNVEATVHNVMLPQSQSEHPPVVLSALKAESVNNTTVQKWTYYCNITVGNSYGSLNLIIWWHICPSIAQYQTVHSL